MTNPSTLSKNDDILTTKLYLIPHLVVFHILFLMCLWYFSMGRILGGSVTWYHRTLAMSSSCGHLCPTRFSWKQTGQKCDRWARKIHSLEKALLESATWRYFLVYSCCVIARCSSWIMEVRLGAGRKYDGLPKLLENHQNSKRVGTIVFAWKKWSCLRPGEKPCQGAEISLDTTWARNGCSTRLSNTPSSKKSDEIHRLELWTCGKPTSYATRMVWITRVKFWSANSVWFLDKTFTTLLKLMRARCFTKQLSPGKCCLWLFQCYRQARQHGTPTVANEAQNPQSLSGQTSAEHSKGIWWSDERKHSSEMVCDFFIEPVS